MTYRINPNITDNLKRRTVDMAVHTACERFKDRIREADFHDNPEVMHVIAQAAAHIAIEQFCAWCNSELALIEAEHKLRADMMRLGPQPSMFKPD